MIIAFCFYIFNYLENLVFFYFYKGSNKSLEFFNYFILFINSRYYKISSFYLNFLDYLKISQFGKITSDILILISVYSFFSIYFFTGSASIAFSNEGLWLSVLSLAFIFFFYYLQMLDNAGKDSISGEITNLQKLILKNSELMNEVAVLEESLISVQSQSLFILENWYPEISYFVEYLDSSDNTKLADEQLSNLVNSIFKTHLEDLAVTVGQRENFDSMAHLKEFYDEVLSQVYENN